MHVFHESCFYILSENHFIDYLKHRLHAHMRLQPHINGCTQTHVDICVCANTDTSTTQVVFLKMHACLHSPKLLLSSASTIHTYLYIPWHMRTSHSDNPASLGKSLYTHTHTRARSSGLSSCIFCHVCSIMNFYTNKCTKIFTYVRLQFPHKQTYICISQKIWVHLNLKADSILISVP